MEDFDLLFNSFTFLIFFPIVLCVYFVIPKKLRNVWLLVCSYFFYMCWNAKYALLLLTSTLITFASGLLIDKFKDNVSRKKLVVAGSVILNLGILFFFKYFNFAADIIESIAAMLGANISGARVDVLLPVGISFYTFQALSYTIDAYRGDIYPERNFINYALFVSFFPQLVAGPIERSKNLLRQLSKHADPDFDRMLDGFMIMLWGYFLKVVLADRIAIFVDKIYGDIDAYPGVYLIIATVLFAVQIYCDFAGYSTIAVGAAKVLGIRIMENFNTPYLADSVADFWRRWHISLTSWFKDYLYIPLGGNRKGKARKYLNKIIVFLLSGLWHGANFTYVMWGALNGIFQVIEEILIPVRQKSCEILGVDVKSLGHRLFKMIITFILVDFTWIFFRAQSLGEALTIINSMLTVHNPWVLFDGSL